MLKKAFLLFGVLFASGLMAYQEIRYSEGPLGTLGSLNFNGTTKCKQAGRTIPLVGTLGPYVIGGSSYQHTLPGTESLHLTDFSGPPHTGIGGGYDFQSYAMVAKHVGVYTETWEIDPVAGTQTLINKVLTSEYVKFTSENDYSYRECTPGE